MKATRLYLYRLFTSLLPETSCFGLKAAMLRWCGAKVGTNVRIGSSATILGVGGLEIGDDVWIGKGCFFSLNSPATLKVGSHIDFGPEVMVLTGTHEIDPNGEHTAGKGTAASVVIGDGCWLGARSMVLPGVALARKTLVAAGSVVTKSVTGPVQLVAGVPGEVKKQLGEVAR